MSPARTSAHTAAGVHEALLARGETLATAESLTGGGLADLVSGTPGASETFVGGVVSYATRVKIDVLGVPEQLVATQGVVSAPCAAAMALGVRRLLGSQWAIATTGVAGPTEQEGKPVGTVFVGVVGPDGVTATRLALRGDRSAIRAATCADALRLLLERIS